MRARIRIANGLIGGALSIYGNMDLGMPKRIHMRNLRDLYLRFCHLTHIGLLLTTITLLSGVIFRVLEIQKRRVLERCSGTGRFTGTGSSSGTEGSNEQRLSETEGSNDLERLNDLKRSSKTGEDKQSTQEDKRTTQEDKRTTQEDKQDTQDSTATVMMSSAFETAYIHLLSLTVTVECFILIVFWVLWHADKQFVVKKENFEGDDSVSFFMNICMHGLPTFFMLVEFFLSEFQGSLWNYYLLSAFFLLYILVMFFFYSETGMWPYPILNLLSAQYRTVFLAYCLGMILVLYALLAFFHKRITTASTKKKKD